MPLYSYKHPTKNQYIDIIQSMSEEHVYIDENNVKWERVWEAPQTAIDSQWDAESPRDFVEKSGRKSGTYGEILEKSQELGQKRAEKHGKDPIKEKYYKEWSKNRRGIVHPEQKKQQLKEKLKGNKHISIEL